MADDRTYIRVHDGMPEHPKVEPLSDAAFRLLISSWCWGSRYLTDGRMPARVWAKRGTAKARRELLEAGLVEPAVDSDDVVLHDYLQHQRSAQQVAEMKAKRAAAGRAGGIAKAARGSTNAVATASPVAGPLLSKNVPSTETDTEPATDVAGGTRKRARRATAAPDDLPITDQMRTWGRDHAPLVIDPVGETAKFLDHARANGKTFADWTAAWRTWMANAQTYAARDSRPALRAVGGGRAGPPPGTPTSEEWKFQ